MLAILGCSLSTYAKGKVEDYVGSYTVTDKAGVKWTIKLNEDGSATFNSKKGTYYCSWDLNYHCPQFLFPWNIDEVPFMTFPCGETDVNYSILTDDGYFYDGGNYYSAKNPKHRLTITKIK